MWIHQHRTFRIYPCHGDVESAPCEVKGYAPGGDLLTLIPHWVEVRWYCDRSGTWHLIDVRFHGREETGDQTIYGPTLISGGKRSPFIPEWVDRVIEETRPAVVSES